LDAKFASFGEDFTISGIRMENSCFEFGANISQQLWDCWTFYVQFNGERWAHSTSYNLISGVSTSW
jgi:hypothetical protein